MLHQVLDIMTSHGNNELNSISILIITPNNFTWYFNIIADELFFKSALFKIHHCHIIYDILVVLIFMFSLL